MDRGGSKASMAGSDLVAVVAGCHACAPRRTYLRRKPAAADIDCAPFDSRASVRRRDRLVLRVDATSDRNASGSSRGRIGTITSICSCHTPIVHPMRSSSFSRRPHPPSMGCKTSVAQPTLTLQSAHRVVFVERRRAATLNRRARSSPTRAPTNMREECAVKSLLDPSFKYVPSASTNIRRTFARIRKQQALQRANVSVLPKRSVQEATDDFERKRL